MVQNCIIVIPGLTRNPVLFRSYLKKVFWHNFFVGASFKILEIREYACGFKLGSAANLNQNPIFEMASKNLCFWMPDQVRHDKQTWRAFLSLRTASEGGISKRDYRTCKGKLPPLKKGDRGGFYCTIIFLPI
jgi:hypothetical protein